MVTANTDKPTIKDYLYGAAAERAVRDEQGEIAAHIMKQLYFNGSDTSNPVLAQAYVDFYNVLRKTRDPETILDTSVGRRISTERTKYDGLLKEMSLGDISGTCLGDGLEESVRSELVRKDGNVKFGEARKKILDYQEDAESRQRKFKRAQEDVQRDYESAMLTAYTNDQIIDIEDDFSEKFRKLQKELHKDLKELEDKYKIKDSQRAVSVVRAMEDAKFAEIRRNAVLTDAYMKSIKLEDLRRLSKN
jgi:hypothetical protein